MKYSKKRNRKMSELMKIETTNQKIQVAETSLELPENLSIHDYFEIGQKINTLHKSTTWLLADLMEYGEGHYGDSFSQVASELGFRPETLRNALYVAKKWPKNRRRKELSFAHHQSVSSMEPEVADRLLDSAIELELSVAELRVLKREYTRNLNGEEETPEKINLCPNCGYEL